MRQGRGAAVATLLLTALIGAALDNIRLARPIALADAPTDRLQCVSYAPFHRPGQTPFDQGLVIAPEQIDADLAVLAAETHCVRTYSVAQGLGEVPRLARRHGLTVLLGVWIGSDPIKNEREIAQALDVAARDRDVIRAMVVGNEVLLRREQPPEALRGYLDRVRAATALPVTYADVWEFWLRNPSLGTATSFITVHILPYWEDDPVAVAAAVPHIVAVHAQVRAAFPGRDVLIGETGWPSAGRNRGGAQPGPIEQARFIRELVIAAEPGALRYNIVEAIDQPWKRSLEGTVGGYWGLFDQNLTRKFAFAGPIDQAETARQRWIGLMVGAIVFALMGAVASAMRGSGGRRRGILLLYLAAGGAIAGQLLAAHAQYAMLASRHLWQGLLHAALLTTAAIGAYAIAHAVAVGAPYTATGVRGDWPAAISTPHWTAILRAARGAFLAGNAIVGILLAFDPRYRDFPNALYALIWGGLAVAHLAGLPRRAIHEERALAGVIVASLPIILWHEGLSNPSALLWCMVSALGAAPVLTGHGDDSKYQRDRG